MKMAVLEIALRLAQDLLLIAAEAAAKGDAGENIGHRILTSEKIISCFFYITAGEGNQSRRKGKEKFAAAQIVN